MARGRAYFGSVETKIETKLRRQWLETVGREGAGARNRTRDTRIFSPLLYRLSYPGVRR